MKDLHAILILAILLAAIVQISLGTSTLENNWSLAIPIIISLIACFVLTLTQRKNQNTFLKHFLKSIKIIVLSMILYFPISLILSFRWVDNFQNSLSATIGKFPVILASSITTLIVMMSTLIISVVISYFVGSHNSATRT